MGDRGGRDETCSSHYLQYLSGDSVRHAADRFGQLGVIALAAVVVGAWVKLGGDRKSLVRPASVLIAAVGLYWFVQRVVGF